MMQLRSDAFLHSGNIPSRYTCDGENVNPPLEIQGVPPGARCLALILDDPDAPNGTFTHWLVWNIPANTTDIPIAALPIGSIEGTNSADKVGYIGPCPPKGTHQYVFTLYALDISPIIAEGGRKQALLDAMKGHIIAEAELVGLYCRS